MLTLALLQSALPLSMILWLALGRPPRWSDLVLRAAAAWLLLLGVALAGIWLALPQDTIAVLSLLMLAATLMAIVRRRQGSVVRARQTVTWGSRGAAVAILFVGGWLALPALLGRVAPASHVDLEFPLKSGRYIVVNGGATQRVNAHLLTLQPRLAIWRGQSYAVDLVRIDEAGYRTNRRQLLAMPRDPRAYLSFGAEVISPCRGKVEAAEESRPDMPVPIRDRAHIVGNFVRLRCGEIVVFLGHFRSNGIDVATGDEVALGQRLGVVGNSGNTDEPHLHIHAQYPGPPGQSLAGEPLFITIGGRFLVRNMTMTAPDPQPSAPRPTGRQQTNGGAPRQ